MFQCQFRCSGVFQATSRGTILALLLGILSVGAALPAQEPAFELKDGDRVALIGATLIERDRHFGHFEAVLRSRFPGKRLEFRNMAWPGDTTTVQLRPLNYGEFEKHVADLKPTVALVSYGSNEAFEGPAGLQSFLAGYNRICDVLEKAKSHIVLISPIRHENLGPPLPSPQAHNSNLELYVSAIDKLARERSYLFVNLFDGLGTQSDEQPAYPLTENGIHLSNYGYWRAASVLADKLFAAPKKWEIEISADGMLLKSSGVRVNALKTNSNQIQFNAESKFVPIPVPAGATVDDSVEQPQYVLKTSGLEGGNYVLAIDDTVVHTASAEDWNLGQRITKGPDFDQGNVLRREVIAKNLMFFYRWRAHNGEYIYGRRANISDNWRSDKDGGNSGNPSFLKEMAEFDRLIRESDLRASDLAKPKIHTYKLIRR